MRIDPPNTPKDAKQRSLLLSHVSRISRITCLVLCWLLAFSPLFLALPASATIIPTAWQPPGGVWNPGVRGGIPDRQTIYTNLPNGSSRTTIQNALNACPSNQVVKLDVGNYNLGGSSLKIPQGVTLRGAGMSNSVVSNGTIFFEPAANFDEDWNATTPLNISSCTKDSSTIVFTGSHGLTVGKYIYVNQVTNILADPPHSNVGTLGTMNWGGPPTEEGYRNMGQYCRVTNVVNSTTVMTDPPMYWNYDRSPQAWPVANVVEMAGLEDLTHVGNTSDDANISFEGGFNCWMKNVEVRGIKKKGVWLYGAMWFTLSGCLIHDAIPVGTDKSSGYISDRVYSVFFGAIATAGLVTDCIIERCTMGAAFEGGVAGNVFSYSIIDEIWWQNTGDSPRRFGPLNHGSHPFMNLIEGVYSSVRLRMDGYWGTSSHYTVLRCRIFQTDRGSDDSQCWVLDIEKNQMYNAILGCSLGGGGGVLEDKFDEILDDASPYERNGGGVMMRIGALNGGGSASAGQLDKRTWTNQLIHLNWMYRTNDSTSGSGVVYRTNNVVDQADTTIPDSFYLTSKPHNFGILAWPPFGPTAPANNSPTNIPAGYRRAFGTNPPAAAGGGGGESGGSSGNPVNRPKIKGLKLKA